MYAQHFWKNVFQSWLQCLRTLPCWAAPACHHWVLHGRTCTHRCWHSSLWCGTAYRGIHVGEESRRNTHKDAGQKYPHLNSKINTNSSHFKLGAIKHNGILRDMERGAHQYTLVLIKSLFVWSLVKDIMHVRTVVGSGTKSSDVELAQLLLLGQLDVVAEVTVVPLEGKGVIMKCLILTAHDWHMWESCLQRSDTSERIK